MTELKLRIAHGLDDVDREAWDAIANPADSPYDPFASWDFLQALEQSASVSNETGWAPHHLLAEDEAGRLLGAMTLYLKGHSYGEYVFDHGWADAFERAGGSYYPKLLTGAPFTPATGRRLFGRDEAVRTALIETTKRLCREWSLSSWHVLFPEPGDYAALGEHGLLQRCDIQFIWRNEAYRDYADFLDALASRKRKALRKEREAAQADVIIEPLTGAAIRPEHWDVFFACYQDTGARKWGTPYLNRDFFQLIHERMADRVLLVMARRQDRYVASALNFIGSETLFGRYWGCLEPMEHVHFELCYHQAIDYAIENGLKQVEAGAQGPHKMARGYRPQAVHSAHYLPDERFADAVGRFLDRERPAVLAEIEALDKETPYKVGS
ncbi:MAG: GNAT family N-acetyltransferase [Pseudomonadota bacterium]